MSDIDFTDLKKLEEDCHGIEEAWLDVRAFHLAFDHPCANSPQLHSDDRRLPRADWLDEEVKELREAATIYEQADAYLDIIYFAVGGLVEMGINPSKLWQLVQAANMAKLWPDGNYRKRPDGKVIKPDGWVAPDEAIHAEINWQIERSAADE